LDAREREISEENEADPSTSVQDVIDSFLNYQEVVGLESTRILTRAFPKHHIEICSNHDAHAIAQNQYGERISIKPINDFQFHIAKEKKGGGMLVRDINGFWKEEDNSEDWRYDSPLFSKEEVLDMLKKTEEVRPLNEEHGTSRFDELQQGLRSIEIGTDTMIQSSDADDNPPVKRDESPDSYQSPDDNAPPPPDNPGSHDFTLEISIEEPELRKKIIEAIQSSEESYALDEAGLISAQQEVDFQRFLSLLVLDGFSATQPKSVYDNLSSTLSQATNNRVSLIIPDSNAVFNKQEHKCIGKEKSDTGSSGNIHNILHPGIILDGEIIRKAEVQIIF